MANSCPFAAVRALAYLLFYISHRRLNFTLDMPQQRVHLEEQQITSEGHLVSIITSSRDKMWETHADHYNT